MLRQFNVFNDVLEGQASTLLFTANNIIYNMRYYLVHGIYSEWTMFFKIIPTSQGEKNCAMLRIDKKGCGTGFGV